MENQLRKPSRSEDICSLEEQRRIQQTVKEQFDASAPQRHTKPRRSEYSASYNDKICSENSGLQNPEFLKFQELQAHKEELIYDGVSPTEEFVETDYYKDLNDIEKQHHTTGMGFIKVETKDDGDFHLGVVSDGCCNHTATNPATNEWIPSAEPVVVRSNKPQRSDK